MNTAATDVVRGTVLVVDDDPAALLTLEIGLQDSGFTVLTAGDGEEACGLYKQYFPDCIITDVMMPGMDGFELCRRVRTYDHGDQTQILVLTSLDDVESIRTAYSAGATDFAQKGINPFVLVERVRFLIRAKRTQDALRESESRLANAQRIAMLGHWERTAEGQTLSVSPIVNRILGLDTEVVPQYADLLSRTHADDRARVAERLEFALMAGGAFSIDHRIVRSDGDVRRVRQDGEVVDLLSAGTQLVRGTLQDVTEHTQPAS